MSTINKDNPWPMDVLVLKLLEVNKDMWHTDIVKEYVKNQVNYYIKNLRQGHVQVKGSYAVLFGNPIEMLQYTTFEQEAREEIKGKIETGEYKDGNTPFHRPLVGYQVYCSKFKNENGKRLAGFRNPHITMGNVLVAENVFKNEFETYFNLTDNIVISNAYDTDVMARLQGQDYDSDELLLTADPILLKAAEACQCDKFLVPINGIEGKKTDRKYNINNEVDIDHKTAANRIGQIVNLSQILNSYYWHYENANDGGNNDGLLKKIYSETSKLSTFSQIEIDRAKKDYGVAISKFLGEIKKSEYNGIPLFNEGKKQIERKMLSPHYTEEVYFLEGDIEEVAYYKNKYPTIESIEELESEKKALQKDLDSNELSGDEKEDLMERKRFVDDELDNIELYLGYDGFEDELNEIYKPLIKAVQVQVQVRPNFLKYCSKDKDRRNTKYLYKHFDTPMDYLQEIIDEIPKLARGKYAEKSIDIAKLIDPPDLRNVNNYQLQKILEDVLGKDEKDSEGSLNNYINMLNFNKHLSSEVKSMRRYDVHIELVERLQGKKINENTIKAILFKAYCEEELATSKRRKSKKSSNKKEYKYLDENYSKIKSLLISCLYQAHTEIFLKVIEGSRRISK